MLRIGVLSAKNGGRRPPTPPPLRGRYTELAEPHAHIRSAGIVITAFLPSRHSALAQQISVHDPAFFAARFLPDPLDLIHALLQVAGDQDFVLRAEIRAPIDINVALFHFLERALAVE